MVTQPRFIFQTFIKIGLIVLRCLWLKSYIESPKRVWLCLSGSRFFGPTRMLTIICRHTYIHALARKLSFLFLPLHYHKMSLYLDHSILLYLHTLDRTVAKRNRTTNSPQEHVVMGSIPASD